MAARKTKETFERDIERLERLTEELERGDLPLEAAIDAYEEAAKAAAACMRRLNAAEERVKLIRKDNGGAFALEDFDKGDTDGVIEDD